MNNSIGKRIREIRKKLNIPQKDFAYTIGISQGHLSKIESGKQMPDKPIIMSIAYSYSINPSWLLTGEGEMFVEQNSKNTMIASGVMINQADRDIINKNNTVISGLKSTNIEDIKNEKVKEIIQLLLEGHYSQPILDKFLEKLKKIKETADE